MRIHSFPPIIDHRARILVSGTAPSVKSLEFRQFYGHPNNYFWRIIYRLFGCSEVGMQPDPAYEDRVAFLQRHKLALWDVIASCERPGSLDANIRSEMPNDIPGLLQKYPGIVCLAFNGSKAYDTFCKHYRHHEAVQGRTLLKLPSTSPIPTKTMRTLEDRVKAWRVIVPYAANR